MGSCCEAGRIFGDASGKNARGEGRPSPKGGSGQSRLGKGDNERCDLRGREPYFDEEWLHTIALGPHHPAG
jgi:hypothetical protein